MSERDEERTAGHCYEFMEVDLRLCEVPAELDALEEHLSLIERQLERIQDDEKRRLKTELSGLDPDDPERDSLQQEFYDRNEFVFPRLFRGTFLLSLYAVYESAVIEIAGRIKKEKSVGISLADIKGNGFLDCAKKYFKHVLSFELCPDNGAWQQIKALSLVRNAFAHTNGRVDLIRAKALESLREESRKGTGIEFGGPYVTVKAPFVAKTFECVRSSLEDLIERYKEWGEDNPPR